MTQKNNNEYIKKQLKKIEEKLYGQQEQEDLDESMKEAFRQRDERLKKMKGE